MTQVDKHHAQPSNRQEHKVKKPDLQSPDVIHKITRGQPWTGSTDLNGDHSSTFGYKSDAGPTTTLKSTTTLGPKVNGTKNNFEVQTNLDDDLKIQQNLTFACFQMPKPPFRSDIKMIKRANITAPGNNTDPDQEYEYFYYYYYDYVYPDELEEGSKAEPLPKPVPLNESKSADDKSRRKPETVKRKVKVKKAMTDAAKVAPVPRPKVLLTSTETT